MAGKLVRDELQEIIQANYQGATFSFLAQEVRQVELGRKLQEEVILTQGYTGKINFFQLEI